MDNGKTQIQEKKTGTTLEAIRASIAGLNLEEQTTAMDNFKTVASDIFTKVLKQTEKGTVIKYRHEGKVLKGTVTKRGSSWLYVDTPIGEMKVDYTLLVLEG